MIDNKIEVHMINGSTYTFISALLPTFNGEEVIIPILLDTVNGINNIKLPINDVARVIVNQILIYPVNSRKNKNKKVSLIAKIKKIISDCFD